MSSEYKPKISVIIPFLNNHDEVLAISNYLEKQTYPSELTEIIFIDNGSDKNRIDPENFMNHDVILIREDDHKNSPYSARNRGIEIATGDVLVFVDANSKPDAGWLENGIGCLHKSGCDLVAGAVQFDFGTRITAAKIVDALTSVNQKKTVAERGAAYTANLFVKKHVFERIGMFEEGVRSGGDVRWTLHAKEMGFTIQYCKKAIVFKYARSAAELYRKKIRTGRGYFFTWRKEKEKKIWFYNLFRSLKPPGISGIQRINPDRYLPGFHHKRYFVWLHIYFTGITEQLAFVYQYLAYTLSSQRDMDRRKEMMNNRASE